MRVMATGRSDYPNQINNVLAFPGVFRGALDARATAITEEMKLAAAQGIASVVDDDELDEDYIIPSVFNRDVSRAVASAVRRGGRARGRRPTARRPEQPTVERAAVSLMRSRRHRSHRNDRAARSCASCASAATRSPRCRATPGGPPERSASTRPEWKDPKGERPPLDALRGRDAVVHLLGETDRPALARRGQARDPRLARARHAQPRERARRAAPRPSARRCWSRSRPPAGTGRAATSASTRTTPAGDDFLAQVVARLGGRGRDGRGARPARGADPHRRGAVRVRAARSRRCCRSSSSASAGRWRAGASTCPGSTSTTWSARSCSRSTPTARERPGERDGARAGDQQGALAGARHACCTGRPSRPCPAWRSRRSTARWPRS